MRVAERDAGEHAAHALRGLGHTRGVGGDRDRELDGALRAQGLRDRERGLDGRALPGDHDLARRVPVGDAEHAVDRCLRDQLRQPLVVEADDRGHPPLASAARALHLHAPLADEADGVGEVEGAGGDQGRVLAHRVPGGEGGVGAVDVECGPLLADGLEIRDRRREQRRLGVLGPVELVLGAFPGEPADRLAEGLVGDAERVGGGGRGLGEGAAHPDGLAALAGEHEGDLVHRAPA